MCNRLVGPCVIAIAAFAAGFAAGPAGAAAIDGDWCRLERSFKIEAPRIRTYFGTDITGDHEDRAFRYIAPANEPEAGMEIFMILRSAETLYLMRRPNAQSQFSDREAWQRCKITS